MSGPRRKRPTPPRPLLSRSFLDSYNRRRLTDALAEACQQKGYAAVTIDDVVLTAGAARATFYKYFENKEAAFLGLLERGFEELLGAGDNACDDREGGGDLADGVEAVLDWIFENIAVARCCLVEAQAAGDDAQRLQLETADCFAERLREAAPSAHHPERFDQMVVDGVWTILKLHLISGKEPKLPQLQEGILAFLRLPYPEA